MKQQKTEKPHHHIHRLKRHRNVLYGIVMVLLILQIVSFLAISAQISRLEAGQGVIKKDVDKYVSDLEREIGEVRQESQFGINTITQEIAQQREDIETQIQLLKASTQEDFSAIIGYAIEGVVNIRTDKSAGTGFIVNPNGYIVTNLHIIQGAIFVQVQTFDGTIYNANLIGGDEFTDLALLQIPISLNKLDLADSDKIQLGEKVIAIGNPLGLSFTVTEGIVSAVNRLGPQGLEAYIQTDVALNPGNSGGPLINKEGEVIGINNFKIGGAESLGFALESNVIRDKINEIANMAIIV